MAGNLLLLRLGLVFAMILAAMKLEGKFKSKLGKIFGFEAVKFRGKLEFVKIKEIKFWRLLGRYYFFLLFVWGIYRFLFRLPEPIEELLLKPLIWLGSLVWIVTKIEKKPLSSLGLSFKNFYKNIYWGIGLGFFFALEGMFANYLKYGQLELVKLSYSQIGFFLVFLTSLVTAFCEELVFRGFFFNRLWEFLKNDWLANLVTSALFTLIHLPVTIFALEYHFNQLLIYALIVFIYSLGAGFVFTKTKSVFSSLLLHVFWNWPLILFR